MVFDQHCFLMVTNHDYDLIQDVEILEHQISDRDKLVSHLHDSRRILAYRLHMQEVFIFSFRFFFVVVLLVGQFPILFQPMKMNQLIIKDRVFVARLFITRNNLSQCNFPFSPNFLSFCS